MIQNLLLAQMYSAPINTLDWLCAFLKIFMAISSFNNQDATK